MLSSFPPAVRRTGCEECPLRGAFILNKRRRGTLKVLHKQLNVTHSGGSIDYPRVYLYNGDLLGSENKSPASLRIISSTEAALTCVTLPAHTQAEGVQLNAVVLAASLAKKE